MSNTNKNKGVKLHLFYVLMCLLLECLDELKMDHPRGKELHKTLTDFCELLNNNAAGTYAVQKTTYFQDLCNKVNTVIRKNFNPNM